jgi:hypothetical protein
MLALIGFETWHVVKPMPAGFNLQGSWHAVSHLQFLADKTSHSADGTRTLQHQIFDRMIELIEGSRQFVVLDLFYFNAFTSSPEDRALSSELVTRLIQHKRAHPGIMITVISDPINTVYGAMEAEPLSHLEGMGIPVHFTSLDPLPDSNPLGSLLWRVLGKPFGAKPGNLLPNPFAEGKISFRTALRLLNFKANHRKVLLVDQGEKMVAMVSTANPHDASWAHSNVAVEFSSPATNDLLSSENAVLALSDLPPLKLPTGLLNTTNPALPDLSLRLITEEGIRRAVLEAIETTDRGDHIQLAMFFLSERNIIDTLKAAAARGVLIDALLDSNRESFGRKRAGIPNLATAHELVQEGIRVRWANTQGEQMHTKLLRVNRRSGQSEVITGSANYTRRNLGGYNLETNIQVRGPSSALFFDSVDQWFNALWKNEGGAYSLAYEHHAAPSVWRNVVMRFQEFTGLSTF